MDQSGCQSDFDNMQTATQAVNKIREVTARLDTFEKLPIRDCLNRVLYEDVISPLNVPTHANSAMDGFALASTELPSSGTKQYKVVGTAYAGKPFTGVVNGAECIKMMTGAVIPDSVDTVVIQENVKLTNDGWVEIGSNNKKHQNIRFAGEDITVDKVVLKRGHSVKPADLGILGSLGIVECKVVRRPRVSFFSTGDELKSIGEVLSNGEIYDSNRYSLHGLLTQANVDLLDMGVVEDDPVAMRKTLLQAAHNSDVVITTGGVSVGEADYIKGVLEEIGTMNFWKVAMKPGRPLTFGKIGNAWFFGLPGNPVAVMVTFMQFVLPCLHKLAGKTVATGLSLTAKCMSAIKKKSNRREYQRGIAKPNARGKLEVELTGKQGSGILTSMSQANCFIILRENQTDVTVGDIVTVEFFKDYF